jgi:soluble lytic murein transglycosylase-like protein
MKKILISLIISLVFLFSCSNKKIEYINHFDSPLFEKYKWLSYDLYLDIVTICKKYNVNTIIICAIINAESRGRNIISKKNKNGTKDYGIMQINSIHLSNNPRQLLNRKLNIEYGIKYLIKCYNRSNKNLKTTIRFYNQGYNGKKHKYKNWKYVNKIYNDIIDLKTQYKFLGEK